MIFNLGNKNKKLAEISLNEFDDAQITQDEMDRFFDIVYDINVLMSKGTIKEKIRKNIKEKLSKIL